QAAAHPDANIIFGAVIDDSMMDQIRVTVIATGFGAKRRQETMEFDAVTAEDEGPRIPTFDLPSSAGEEDLDIPAFLKRRNL
ncbi:MAG: cell division protein FtsZ, partial [Coriobacteriia bacterium]|nr:cell division protein FtsZ [Coriobacteriia bacterium]